VDGQMSGIEMRDTQTHRKAAPWPALSLLVLYWMLVAPVILSGRGGPSEAVDQDRNHVVVIGAMLEQWPNVDIVNYASATSPGYHLSLAAINRLIAGPDLSLPLVRWCNALLSMALLLVVYLFACRALAPWGAASLCLPLLFSPYFLGAAIFLTTDNAALLFVAIALGGAIFLPRRPLADLSLGVSAACAVGVRQIHAWVVGPVGFAGLLASPLALRLPGISRMAGPEPLSWRNMIFGAMAGVMPLALLVWFVSLWGGLMPPEYKSIHDSGANPATFAFALALTGGFGVLFFPLLSVGLRPLLRCPVVWLGAIVGLVAALVVPTGYTPPAEGYMPPRAFGALWRIVGMAPEVSGRSLLLTAMAPVGGAVVVALAHAGFRAGRRRETVVLLLSMFGWVLAQSFNSMAWQRYFEPMLLIFLIWSAAMGMRDDARRLCWRWGGVALLALGELSLTALSLYREVIDAGAPG
jgi:hypothetical protein